MAFESTRHTFGQSHKLAICTLILLSALGAAQAAQPKATVAPLAVMGHEPVRQLFRAYFTNIKLAQGIAHSKFETLESNYELGYVVVQASADEARELRSLGFRLEADAQWLQRQAEQHRNENMVTTHAAAVAEAASFVGIPGYSCYPLVEEVFAAGDQLIAARPNLASWIDIGDSWAKTRGAGGYDLKVLKMTNSATTGPKPILFIQAGIHAREYTTTPLALAFAQKLVNGHGSDADMTWILDHHEVHILLVTNPDGRKQAERGISWRKNTNTNYCGATSNLRGADLNRNFTFAWNSTGGAGSSGNTCNETYRGPTAGSEPETQAIQAYIKTLWADNRGPGRNDAAPLNTSGIHLDIHSHGKLLLWPWGTEGTAAPNDSQLATLGRKFAFWNGHTPQRSLGLYPTDGTSDGPSYGELGVAAFTFELGTAFFQSCSYYNSSILEGNLKALVYAAKVARAPYITPAGPDSGAITASKNGNIVSLKATLDDTHFSSLNGTEATQAIAGAEYYVDVPPWVPGAQAVAMTAVDGSFNNTVEQAQASIDASTWSAGKHIIYVRGRDTANSWGAVSATFVNTGPAAPPVAAFNTSTSGMQVSFTDQSTDDGSIVTRSWSFGDGSSSSLASVKHAYASGGTFSVRLTVTDNDGLSSSLVKSVTVTDDGVQQLVNNQTVTGISLARAAWRYFKLAIPVGAKNLSIVTSGGTGDVDLYTQDDVKPTTNSFICNKEGSTNAETCTSATPNPGMMYIGVLGYAASAGVSLKVAYTP